MQLIRRLLSCLVGITLLSCDYLSFWNEFGGEYVVCPCYAFGLKKVASLESWALYR